MNERQCPECNNDAAYTGTFDALWGWLYACNNLDCRAMFWWGIMQVRP